MQRRGILSDPLAAGATALLLLVVLWRIGLAAWLPAPARAESLRAGRAAEAPNGRLLLLVDGPGTAPRVRNAIARARDSWPDLPLETHSLGTADPEIRALIRAYGYDELPVLLTLDRAGHVVRIAPQ